MYLFDILEAPTCIYKSVIETKFCQLTDSSTTTSTNLLRVVGDR